MVPWNAASYVYGIQSGEFIKVGIAQCVDTRLNMFRLHNPHPLTVVMKRRVFQRDARRIEMRAHELLSAYSTGREWFATDPMTVRAACNIAVRDIADLNSGTSRPDFKTRVLDVELERLKRKYEKRQSLKCG